MNINQYTFHPKPFVVLAIVLAILFTLTGCADKPTDTMIKAVSDNCNSQGMVVEVWYNGGQTSIECVHPN